MAEDGAEGSPLAAALFDLPGAHPDSAALRLILSDLCTDPGVQAGLFSACRPGHEWALEHAPKMTVSLTVPSPSWPLAKPPDEKVVQAWPAKLAFVSEALRHRGSQTQETCLKLTCDRGTHAECLAAVPEALNGAGAGIKALVLLSPDGIGFASCQVITAFLGPAATAFTNLKSLTLDTCFAILPDPSLLPHLAHLCTQTIWIPDWDSQEVYQEACASIGRFVPQLTSLYIDRPTPSIEDIPWDTIFTHTSDTLQVFGTDMDLTDDLYAPLTTRLSNLGTVNVSSLHLHFGKYPTTPWPGWKELKVRYTTLSDITMMLPAPTNSVNVRVSMLAIHGKIPDDRLQPWLDQAQWHILPRPGPRWGGYEHMRPMPVEELKDITLHARDADELTERLTSLQAMKYEPTDIPKLTIGFDGLQMTAAAMHALERLPHGALIDFSECRLPLEPAAYTQLAQHVPTSFSTWQIHQAGAELVQSVCAGINARRGALSLPRVRVELDLNSTVVTEDTQIGECVVLGPEPYMPWM